jgi:hypothetical protein
VSEENLELVRSIYERWERGDFSSVEWADPEIQYSAPGGVYEGVQRGIEAMGRAWADWLAQFEEFESHAVEYLENEDQVVVLTRFGGRGKGSGVPITEIPGAARFRIREAKVVELGIYTDPDWALRDAGIER